MKGLKMMNAITAVVVIVTFFYTQIAFSFESTIILGDIVASGNVEIKTTSGNWQSITNRSYPIVSGAHLKSGDGRMSITMKDGTRLEAGKGSEIIINGERGKYSVNLSKGPMGFSVQKGVYLSVSTPNAIVHTNESAGHVQKVVMSKKDNINGIIFVDSKGTKVIAVSGSFIVKDANASNVQMLSAGKAVHVTTGDSGIKITPVVLPAEGEDSSGIDWAEWLPYIAIGAGVVVIAAIVVVAVAGQDDDGGGASASPSSP